MSSPTPAINRMVHYVSYGTPGGEYPMACRAALITAVGAWVDDEIRDLVDSEVRRRVVVQHWDPTACSLTVHNPSGMFLNGAIPYDGGAPWTRADETSELCTGLEHHGGTWHWPVMM